MKARLTKWLYSAIAVILTFGMCPTLPATAIAEGAPDGGAGLSVMAPSEDPNVGNGTGFDNSTSLADGVYAPEDYTFTGGTGKTKITCTSVNVQGLEGAEGEQQGVDIATLTANGAVEEGDLPWYIVLGDFVFQYQPTF